MNDILVAVLFRELEGPAAGPLASEVNKTIADAIKRVKQVPEISVQTLDYRTQPIYQKERVTGWRVRQSIRLETRDAVKLSSLLGELQQQLGLDSIGSEVSPERMREAEDKLIASALKAFQQRADLVTRELGRTRYRIVTIRVETNDSSPRPFYGATRAMAMEAAAPPPIEAGEQPVHVTVSGTIELQTN
jgi:predicted secreted protein